jgi:protein SCO1/2
MNAPSWKRALVALLLGVAILTLSACGAYTFAGTAYNPVIAAPEIVGTQGNGAEFRLSDLRDKVVLLFFGYTNCPDICPMTLGEMKQVQTQLGDKAKDVAFVLVSLDPDRDTPERLLAYTEAFSPDFIGVHVPTEALDGVNGEAGVKKGYGVFSEKRILDEANPDDYAVDHTGWTYVIDREGDLREVLSQDVEIAGIVKDIEYLLR